MNIDYPYKRPKVLCLNTQKVSHPNISKDGNVCISLIKENWSPIYTLSHIVLSLINLIQDPNFSDPIYNNTLETTN